MSTADNTASNSRVFGRPFTKGVSGNPNGRPKGSFSIKDKIRWYLDENPEEVAKIVKYFVEENRELMWTMLEGSPKAVTDIKLEDKSVYEPSKDELELARQLVELQKKRITDKTGR